MTNKYIDFYFDYISHNAYLMWHMLPRLAERYGRRVRPIPVLFAGFLKAHGQLGPAEVVPKCDWMNRNVLRKTVELGIAFNVPKQHPFQPLLLLRMTAADMPEEQRRSLTEVLFRGVWVDKLDPNNRDQISDYLQANGLHGAPLIDAAKDSPVKLKVKTNTEQCLARGGFGVPTAIVDDELFWGFDDLPYIEKYLAGDDPLQTVDVDRFRHEWTLCAERGAHRERR